MGAIASQITSLTVVYSAVYSDADERKLQCSASLAFVRGIHRGPVNSPHKWPVTRKMLPFDDVIMYLWVRGGCILRRHKSHPHGLKMNHLANPWNHRPLPYPQPHLIPTSPHATHHINDLYGCQSFSIKYTLWGHMPSFEYGDMTS